MTTRRIFECAHCRSKKRISWRFNKPFCDACKLPAYEEKGEELDERDEYCACGNHFSECTCGKTSRARPQKQRRRPAQRFEDEQ